MVDIIDSIITFHENLGSRKLIRLSFTDVIKEQKNDFPAAYFIRGVDGSFYVGGTKRLKARLNQHRGYMRAGTHANAGLQKLYNSLGEAKISFWIIPCETKTEAQQIETQILKWNHGGLLCLNVSSDPLAPIRGYDRSDVYRRIREYHQSDEGRLEKSRRSKIMWQNAAVRAKIIEATGEAITVDGVKYLSVREASRQTGYCISALRNSLINGVVDTKNIKPFKRKVSANGCVYGSIKEAAVVYGIKDNTMHYRCSSTDPKWVQFFFC